MRTSVAALALVLGAGTAQAATVRVTVTGVANDRGNVLVAICTRGDFLRPHCPYKAHVPAKAGAVTAIVVDVPPGLYAAQAFHDENANGKLDRTLLGLPREAMGFSRDAPMRRGPPKFGSASFSVSADGAAITFALRYF